MTASGMDAMQRRLNVLVVVLCVLAGLVLARTLFLVAYRGELAKQWTSNRFEHAFALPPRRGEIFDRDGKRIAANRKVHALLLYDPAECAEKLDASALARLGLGLTAEDVEQLRRTRRDDMPVAFTQDTEAVGNLERALQELGCSSRRERVWRRDYPLGRSVQFVSGAVNVWGVGAAGVEGQFEAELAGRNGLRRYLADGSGALVRMLEERGAVHGRDIHLSLSVGLSTELEALLREPCRRASAVRCMAIVADAGCGEILAAVKADTREWDGLTKYLEPGTRGSATFVENKFESTGLALLLRAADAMEQGRREVGKEYLRRAARIAVEGKDALPPRSLPGPGERGLSTICGKLGVLEPTGIELPAEAHSICGDGATDSIRITPIKIVQVIAVMAGSGQLAPLTVLDGRRENPVPAQQQNVARSVLSAETAAALAREFVAMAKQSGLSRIEGGEVGAFPFSGQGIAFGRSYAIAGQVGFGKSNVGRRVVVMFVVHVHPEERDVAPALTREIFGGTLLAALQYF